MTEIPMSREQRVDQRYQELEIDAEARALLDQMSTAIGLVPASEIRNRKLPPWLVDGMFPETGVGAIWGASDQFKSFVVLNLLMSVCNGRPFLGHTVGTPGACVYLLGEGEYDAGIRLDAVLEDDPSLSDQRLSYVEQAFDLTGLRNTDLLISQLVQVENLRMVVFDARDDFIEDGNSPTVVNRMLKQCKRVSKELRCFVLLVHHTAHDESRMTGAKRFFNGLDVAIKVSGGSLTCTKMKPAPKFEPLYFTTETVGASLVVRATGVTGFLAQTAQNDSFSMVKLVDVIRNAPGTIRSDVPKLVGIGNAKAYALLDGAVEQGLLTEKKAGRAKAYYP